MRKTASGSHSILSPWNLLNRALLNFDLKGMLYGLRMTCSLNEYNVIRKFKKQILPFEKEGGEKPPFGNTHRNS